MRRTAFLLAVVLLAPLAAAAQDFTQVTPLSLTIDPQYPSPNTVVTVTPDSTTVDLTSETLTWKVNGKTLGTTTGTASFGVAVGGPGTATTVSVSANGSGGSYAASITINPGDVALIPEPETTVHPLYQGSPLVGSESNVRLVAMADLRTSSGRIDPSKLVYDWKLDDQELTAQSGIGQNVLPVQAPQMYRDATVYVTVSDQAGTVFGEDSYDLAPSEPTMRLYVDDPLLGPLYDTALGSTYAMPNEESSFVAVPYSFAETPSIAWTIGGTPSTNGPLVTVRSNGNGSGDAVIAATAQGSSLETAGAQSDVNFKGTGSGGFTLFGL